MRRIRRKRDAFRLGIIRERGCECQNCHALSSEKIRPNTQTYLHLHHLLPVKFHRDLKYQSSNVILLCQRCHIEFEGKLKKSGSNVLPTDDFRPSGGVSPLSPYPVGG